MCPWVLLPEHPGGRHKSVVGTVFPSQNRYRAPRRTALNPGFASRGPETGEEVPCGVHSQTHRKGPEGGAGNPASFLSRLVIPHSQHPTVPHPSTPSAGRISYPFVYAHQINPPFTQQAFRSSGVMPGLWLPWQSQKAGRLPPWNTRHPAQRRAGPVPSTCVRRA